MDGGTDGSTEGEMRARIRDRHRNRQPEGGSAKPCPKQTLCEIGFGNTSQLANSTVYHMRFAPYYDKELFQNVCIPMK